MSSDKDFDEWFVGKTGPVEKLHGEWMTYSRRKKDKAVEIDASEEQIVNRITYIIKDSIKNGIVLHKKTKSFYFNIKSEDPGFHHIKLKKETFDNICTIIKKEFILFQLCVTFTLLKYHPDGFPRIVLTFQLEKYTLDSTPKLKPRITMDRISLIE